MQLYRTDVYVVIFTYKFISMVNYTRLATVNMYIYLHIYIYIYMCVCSYYTLSKSMEKLCYALQLKNHPSFWVYASWLRMTAWWLLMVLVWTLCLAGLCWQR